MKKFILIIIILFTQIATASAIDWWPMLGHDLEHKSYSNSSFDIDELNVTWKIDLEAPPYAPGFTANYMATTPVVKDDKVYINTENYFYIYNIENKTTLRFNHSPAVDCSTPEAYSVPAIAEGKVCYSDQGHVYCRNSITGDLLWQYNETGIEFMYVSPVIHNGILWIGSERHENDYRKYDINPSLYAFNLSNGNIIWKFSLINQTDMAIHATTPVIYKGVVYVATAETFDGSWFNNHSYLLGINESNGSQLLGNYSTNGVGSFYLNSPAAYDNRIFITTHTHGNIPGALLAFNIRGKLLWRINLTDLSHDFERSIPIIYEDSVIVASFNNTHFNIYALNQTDGDLIWRNSQQGRIWSSPSRAKNRIFIGTYSSYIYVFNAKTGDLIWNHTITNSTDIPSTPSIVGGVAFFGDEGGFVHAFDSKPYLSNIKVEINKTTKIIKAIVEIEDLTLNKSYVKVELKYENGTIKKTLNLYDDGLHDDEVANDNIFGNSWNASHIKRNETYLADLIARDNYLLEKIIKHASIVSLSDYMKDSYSNYSLDLFNNTENTINASNLNVSLEINIRENTTGSINIISYSENPETEEGVFGARGIGIIQIEASDEIDGNISFVIIKIYYTDEEIASQGINESSLVMYKWNTTLQKWEKISDSGVDTVKNYVYANVTHFSEFGAFGQLPSTILATASSSEGSTGISGWCGDTYCNPDKESCSDCPKDCGECLTPITNTTIPTTAIPTPAYPKTEETEEETGLPAITGAAIGNFAKTKTGKGIIIFLGLVVVGVCVQIFINFKIFSKILRKIRRI